MSEREVAPEASGQNDIDEGEGEVETSVPAGGSSPALPTSSVPASLNAAFFGPEPELTDGQTRYVQTRDCLSGLGAHFSLMGFSFVVPAEFSREECDTEGLRLYTRFRSPAPMLRSYIGVSAMSGTASRGTLSQIGSALVPALVGDEVSAAEVRPLGVEAFELHGSEFYRQEFAVSFPEDHTGDLHGNYLAQVVPVARPFMRDGSGTINMSPGQPGLVVLSLERIEEGDESGARNRLRLGATALLLSSLRFSLPDGFSAIRRPASN